MNALGAWLHALKEEYHRIAMCAKAFESMLPNKIKCIIGRLRRVLWQHDACALPINVHMQVCTASVGQCTHPRLCCQPPLAKEEGAASRHY